MKVKWEMSVQEGFVYYLPIATTAISLAFLLVLIRRAALRRGGAR